MMTLLNNFLCVKTFPQNVFRLRKKRKEHKRGGPRWRNFCIFDGPCSSVWHFFMYPPMKKQCYHSQRKKLFFIVPYHKNDFNPIIKWRKQEKENTERKRLKNLNNAYLPHLAKNSPLVLIFSKFSSTFVFSHEYLIHWKSKSITSEKVPFLFQRSLPKKMLHWWRRTIENAGIPPSWTPALFYAAFAFFFSQKKLRRKVLTQIKMFDTVII